MTEAQRSGTGLQRDHSQQIVDAISHDFRAPSRQVKSFTQLLEAHLGDGMDDETREYLGLISSAADMLHEKLEALSRLSWAATAELKPEPLRTGEILEEVVAQLAARGLDNFEIEAADLTARVIGDREQLTRVFAELIQNSQRFCAPPVLIRIASLAGDGGCLITIADNGPGFSAKDPSAAFNLFKRFHDRTYAGTGTGLAVVRSILDRHQSEVTLESDAQTGTTVTFTLALDDSV